MGVLCFLDDYKVIAETRLVAAEDLHYNSLFLRFWYWLREKQGMMEDYIHNHRSINYRNK